MLIIDGAKYELWQPTSEDDFEKIVKEHIQDIFGEKSIYIDIKPKLKSIAGIGSTPDGLAIVCNDKPEWHIVEFELSSHPLHDHIVSQVARFISAIGNYNIQKRLTDAVFSEINNDDYLNLRFTKLINSNQTYKYISDLISNKPFVTIIIEEDTPELREAVATLSHPNIKIIEFMSYFRKQVGLTVHAHIFQPLFTEQNIQQETTQQIKVNSKTSSKIDISELINSGKLQIGQIIFGNHNNKKYEGTILPNGKVKLSHNGQEFNSLSMSAKSIVTYNINGWRWWKTIGPDGKEITIAQLYQKCNPFPGGTGVSPV